MERRGPADRGIGIHGGTIFLDEIGEASARFQTQLVRVLEERIQRIGDESRPYPWTYVWWAATRRDLEAEVRTGRFREALYLRLTIFCFASKLERWSAVYPLPAAITFHSIFRPAAKPSAEEPDAPNAHVRICGSPEPVRLGAHPTRP